MFREAGINRISLGVQSLREDDLKYLGRNHSSQEALSAISLAKSIFPKVSFDLIYSRHNNQTPDKWRQELREALSLECGHISLYNLTFEGNTLFHRQLQAGVLDPVDDNLQADLYDVLLEEVNRVGMEQYEVSNYAFSGQECKHNVNYWTLGDYIGIGPGAAGRVTLNEKRVGSMKIKSPHKWKEAVNRLGTGTDFNETTILSDEESMIELLMVGLRIKKGISISNFKKYSGGKDFMEYFGHKLTYLIEEDLLNVDELSLIPTKKGLKYHDAVLRHLI